VDLCAYGIRKTAVPVRNLVKLSDRVFSAVDVWSIDSLVDVCRIHMMWTAGCCLSSMRSAVASKRRGKQLCNTVFTGWRGRVRRVGTGTYLTVPYSDICWHV
jgi:hypothetical protein